MKERVDEPSDAPFGPVARYFRRWSMGDGVTTGGALGCDAVSPRLEGWLKITGFDLTSLSRKIDAATSWAIATPGALREEAKARVVDAKVTTLQPLAVRLWEDHGPKHGKAWLSERIAAAFAEPSAFPEHVQQMVRDVIASGVLETANPKARAIADWMDGKSLDEILGDRRGAFADHVAKLKPLLAWIASEVQGHEEVTHRFLAEQAVEWIDAPDSGVSVVAAELAEELLGSGIFADEPDAEAAILRWIDPYSIEELTSGE